MVEKKIGQIESSKEYYKKNKERKLRYAKEYAKEYIRRPGVIERKRKNSKAHGKRPEAIERRKKYRSSKCFKEKQKNYYEKNKESILKDVKERYRKNREKILKYAKEYRQRSEAKEKRREYLKRPEVKEKAKQYLQRPEIREKVKKCHRRYRKLPEVKKIRNERQKIHRQNPEAKKRRRKYLIEYNQRPNVIKNNKKYYKKRKENNVNFAIRNRLRNRLRKALKQYTVTGKIKHSTDYEIDYGAIIKHLSPFPLNRHLYHIDHIIPLVSFDLEDPEQVKLAFAPSNHQWLLAFDNLSKGRKLIE